MTDRASRALRVAGGLALGTGLAMFLLSALGFAGGGGSTPTDPTRLLFTLRSDGGFWMGDASFAYDQMLARIRAGSRTDVTLLAAGDVVQSDYDNALARLRGDGISVWTAA